MYCFCGLRELLAVFASKQPSGAWVSDNDFASASHSPKDVLCSVTFVLFIFWLSEQQW